MSRIHCSFVFPEEISRPFPQDEFEIDELETNNMYQEDFEELDDEGDLEAIAKERRRQRKKQYEREKVKALRQLEKNKDKFLKMDDETGLLTYSPKYNEVLSRIQTTNGTAFVYTEYKSLEGINVLRIILKANGYGELIIKTEDKENFSIEISEEDKGKPLFALWEGSNMNSEVLRKIYNNDFGDLPDNIKEVLNELGGTNLHGEILKVLLTTRTGAEGIDLKNVRQVHIIEPYWNPVRLDQIKGRAVRVGSHIQLPEDERNVDIFVYLSIITKDQAKTDIEIESDKDGASSDIVLYEISERKRRLMNQILKAVKEASVDCSLNLLDTQIMEDPFQCVNVRPSSQLTGSMMSYLPNIYDDPKDAEKKRRIEVERWMPQYVKIKGKEYALRKIDDTKQHIYDATKTKMGRPGNPVGEIITKNQKREKIVMYRKKK